MLATPAVTETDRIEAFLDHRDVAGLDVSMFEATDLVNLALQRSGVLYGLDRKPGDIVRAWQEGRDASIEEAVATLGHGIARRAAAAIRSEFDGVMPWLAPASRIADIGCGYAIFDLFAARATGADVLLVDTEEGPARHFGFAAEGAAYTRLSVARSFLEANGVAPERIETVNPAREPFDPVAPVDVAVSFLSCGFHYPVSSYDRFFRNCVRPGGRILLDLRRQKMAGQLAQLASLGAVQEIEAGTKSVRIALTRGAE